MHVDPKTEIAGVPALQVRDALHDIFHYMSKDYLRERLGISKTKAAVLLAALLARGYIAPTQTKIKHLEFKKTDAGQQFALASGAKPVSRATAERALEELLSRVKDINNNDAFAYYVQRVMVFGSYLTKKEKLSDLDVVIEINRRANTAEEHQQCCQARIALAKQSGRRFSNFIDLIGWPETEVRLLLKNRSRVLQIQPDLASLLPGTPTVEVYPNNKLYAAPSRLRARL